MDEFERRTQEISNFHWVEMYPHLQQQSANLLSEWYETAKPKLFVIVLQKRAKHRFYPEEKK